MLLREVIIEEVCKYFDEVDILRILCTCKILNILVKKYVRIITGDYHPRYEQFIGLKKADFGIKPHNITALPPNLAKLKIYDLDFDYKLLPKSLTSLTITTGGGNVEDVLYSSLVKLDIGSLTGYNNHITTFTNLQDLRICTLDHIDSLPPNLTRLHIDVNHCLDYIWPILPQSLTHFDVVCVLSDVYMRDLPQSLKLFKYVLGDNDDFDEYEMKRDDYFNKGLECLHTIMTVDDVQHILLNIPITITTIDVHIYYIGINVDKLAKALPRTLLNLGMHLINTVGKKFYRHLPPNLRSLYIEHLDDKEGNYVYPSLLPRSLTKLQEYSTGDYLHVKANDCVDFPPNIISINGILIDDDRRIIDFSKLIYLQNLNILDDVDCNIRIVLPLNLRNFNGNISYTSIPDGLISCHDTQHVTSSYHINKLPKSITKLTVNSIDDYDLVIFPPKLRELSIHSAKLNIDQLNKLPTTLTSYMQRMDRLQLKLIRTIDGRIWKHEIGTRKRLH